MAVTLQEAKDWLRIDTNTDDTLITELIAAAETWVETYTCYVLNSKTVTLGEGCHEVYEYPFTIANQSEKYKVETRSLKSVFEVQPGGSAVLDMGYTSPSLIPKNLLVAVKKLITYLYENRDVYEMGMPFDVQILINQYRRQIAWS